MKGIGAMLSELGGNAKSVAAIKGALGKRISALDVNEDRLRIALDDGFVVELYDDAQSCCERRYMKCDDDLAKHVGEQLLDAKIKDGPDEPAGQYGEVTECAFLVVTTGAGDFTVANYNEHNGYYGGIEIRARVPEEIP